MITTTHHPARVKQSAQADRQLEMEMLACHISTIESLHITFPHCGGWEAAGTTPGTANTPGNSGFPLSFFFFG